MIGIEITFLNEHGHGVDHEGPCFDNTDIPFHDIRTYLEEEPKGSIQVNTNGYLGNENEGFEFNDAYRQKVYMKYEDFENDFNT